MSQEQIAPTAATPVQESVTLLIQQKVRSEAIVRYEAWLKVIAAKAAEYAGHQGARILRPLRGGTAVSLMSGERGRVMPVPWMRTAPRRSRAPWTWLAAGHNQPVAQGVSGPVRDGLRRPAP